jgi:hypothetical protein
MTVTRATLLEAAAVRVGAPMLALGIGLGAMTVIAPPAHADQCSNGDNNCWCRISQKDGCRLCYRPDGSLDYWIGNCGPNS